MTAKPVSTPGAATLPYSPQVLIAQPPPPTIEPQLPVTPPLILPSGSGVTPLPGSFPTGPTQQAPAQTTGTVPDAATAAKIVAQPIVLPGAVSPDGSISPPTTAAGVTVTPQISPTVLLIAAAVAALLLLRR